MINKATLVGRLGKDPEVRYTPDGMAITNFTMATDEQRKDKNGEKVQKTEWHRIVTFGKLADICAKYLVKGKLVYIEGKIQTRTWTDKNDVKQYTTEIVANDMKMLDSKGQRDSDTGRDEPPLADPGDAPVGHYDDDIPF